MNFNLCIQCLFSWGLKYNADEIDVIELHIYSVHFYSECYLVNYCMALILLKSILILWNHFQYKKKVLMLHDKLSQCAS
jgi:hypothetical protein